MLSAAMLRAARALTSPANSCVQSGDAAVLHFRSLVISARHSDLGPNQTVVNPVKSGEQEDRPGLQSKQEAMDAGEDEAAASAAARAGSRAGNEQAETDGGNNLKGDIPSGGPNANQQAAGGSGDFVSGMAEDRLPDSGPQANPKGSPGGPQGTGATGSSPGGS